MAGADDLAEVGFAGQLRARRQAAGLSQRELATLAGIGVATIRDLEQARSRRPHPNSVRALQRALGLTAAEATLLREAADPLPSEGVPTVEEVPTVGILGPLLVRIGGVAVPLVSTRQRALLGRLALSAGAAVWQDELIDVLWGQAPPASAKRLLQTYVSRLRRLFGRDAHSRLGPRLDNVPPGGYQLRIDAEQLDVLRFRKLVGEVHAAAVTAPAVALELVGRALSLWRGALLEDLPTLAGHPLAVALTNERIAATLLHADLAADLGRHVVSVPGLHDLAGQHTLHEAVHARLILALAGSGQQAAALAVFDELRGRLAEELGIDPGAELVEYRDRVLRQEWTYVAQASDRPAVVPGSPSHHPGEPAVDLLCLLDLHPGREISVPAAASLAGLAPGAARDLLAELADAGLIVERAPDRYERVDSGPGPVNAYEYDVGTSEAVRRMYGHYLHTAHAAARLLEPDRAGIVVPVAGARVVLDAPIDAAQAVAWFEREHEVLVAAAEAAPDAGLDVEAWQLTWTLTGFLDRRRHSEALTRTGLVALDAARRLGDRSGQAHARRTLALAARWSQRYDEAHAQLDDAFDRFGALADHAAMLDVLLDRGRVCEGQRGYPAALRSARAALDLVEDAGPPAGRARALGAMGRYQALLGAYDEAITCCLRALELQPGAGDLLDRAGIWDTLGYAHLRSGRYQEAISCYRQALDLCRDARFPDLEAPVLAHLADVYDAYGDPVAAHECRRQVRDHLSRRRASVVPPRRPDARGR
jgi:DNA-binding SARP family transcriptional activator/DNA-binding XRE family transcriptional regulator